MEQEFKLHCSTVDEIDIKRNIAEFKLLIKSLKTPLEWEYIKRIIKIIAMLCINEHSHILYALTTFINEDTMNTKYFVFARQNIVNLQLSMELLQDAKNLDKLGTQGLSRLCIQTQLMTYQDKIIFINDAITNYSVLFTKSAKCIATSRIKIMKQFLTLLEVENTASDISPQCTQCFKRGDDVYFLRCFHAYCSTCVLSSQDTVHCTKCNETFFDEVPNKLVDYF